ncbi:MAG: hypothetical protein E7554_08845 [Ruminococcaceae bacterium]|nr:hypothetical protein [Oscillospiraceae bacterium]
MKRILSIFLAALLALTALCAAGCGDDDVDWVTGETYATSGTGKTTAATDAANPTDGSAAGIEGSYPAPQFRPGKYSMVNTSTTVTEYVTENGAVYYSESAVSQYTYGLDISAAGSGLRCVMSFDGILITQTVSGETMVLLDTSTRDYLSASTEPYYDIIGQSFVVSIGADGSVTGIEGVEDIIAEYPGSAMLLDKDNLTGVASSFFYPIPDTFADGTAWTLKQYDLENIYRLTSLARDRFGITITGPEQQPFSYPTEDGLTLDYSKVSPLSGTLYMNKDNRALQEITSMQKSSGTITGEGVDIIFNYNVTSLTTVTEKQ